MPPVTPHSAKIDSVPLHPDEERLLIKTALMSPQQEVDEQGRENLVGLSREELLEKMTALKEKPFRVKQIWHWMYHQGVRDFSEMANISRPLQEKLSASFFIGRPEQKLAQLSKDGTEKILFGFDDKRTAEAVYIPDQKEDRGAVCVSSQIGCTLACSFCHTGTQKLLRNLSSSEIVGQFMAMRDHYNEWPTPKDGTPRKLSNIVMMGMGEPLYNYQNVAKALSIIMDGEGIALSRRRITLSTSGIVPMIRRCGKEIGVNLAISLHAVTDELRNKLVPINRKYPLKELLKACEEYPSASNSRRLTFEYIMLKGINDSPAEARELARLLKNMPAKVNLIPFNPWPGSDYEPSTPKDIKNFADILSRANIAAPVRTPRGRDILAACGQLKTLHEGKENQRPLFNRKSERQSND
ncbi:23S rRNA (adenine(2503)-C(2))-methyltransferase RlmN [Acetobacteraceae bacterium]|nr:23S rRNA (adenine(2503)-C(2))-methyltransferase RlmN [Acetobacteraceae bacterium]